MALLVCIAFGSVPARLNGLSITDTDPVDYLIIAPNDAAMIREIVPLAEKKTEKGLSARILTVDSIGASYPGRDIAEKMAKNGRNRILKDFTVEKVAEKIYESFTK